MQPPPQTCTHWSTDAHTGYLHPPQIYWGAQTKTLVYALQTPMRNDTHDHSLLDLCICICIHICICVPPCSFLVQSFSSFFQLSQPIPLHHFAFHPLHPPLTHIFNHQLHIHKLIYYPPSFLSIYISSLYISSFWLPLFTDIHPHYLLSLIKLLFIVSN